MRRGVVVVVWSVRWCAFFFSSRRRHTRCLSDWSSDVCSSDLAELAGGEHGGRPEQPLQLEGREQSGQIGRASCRERVWSCVAAVALTRKSNAECGTHRGRLIDSTL